MFRWKPIRVFVSSTFRDMQSEREHLQDVVLPRLRQWCSHRAIDLAPLDIRWGISDESEDDDIVDTIASCLSNIDGCRPIFLGIVGNRYSWLPDELPEEQMKWLSARSGNSRHSITHLEWLHAVLCPVQSGAKGLRSLCDQAFFYFRDPNSLPDPESLTELCHEDREEYRRIFFERPAKKFQVCFSEESATAVPSNRVLTELKGEIRRRFEPLGRVYDYRGRWYPTTDSRGNKRIGHLVGLEDFGRRVEADVKHAVEEQLSRLGKSRIGKPVQLKSDRKVMDLGAVPSGETGDSTTRNSTPPVVLFDATAGTGKSSLAKIIEAAVQRPHIERPCRDEYTVSNQRGLHAMAKAKAPSTDKVLQAIFRDFRGEERFWLAWIDGDLYGTYEQTWLRRRSADSPALQRDLASVDTPDAKQELLNALEATSWLVDRSERKSTDEHGPADENASNDGTLTSLATQSVELVQTSDSGVHDAPSPRDLAQAYRDGDQAAFAQLWNQYEPYLRRLVCRHAGEKYEVVDEAIQELALRLLSPDVQRSYDPFLPWHKWAGRILRNMIISTERRLRRLVFEPLEARHLLSSNVLADYVHSSSIESSIEINAFAYDPTSSRVIPDALDSNGYGSQVFHRDLKPMNILATPHVVKVMDFGIAKVVGPEQRKKTGYILRFQSEELIQSILVPDVGHAIDQVVASFPDDAMKIMEPMFVQALLGSRLDEISQSHQKFGQFAPNYAVATDTDIGVIAPFTRLTCQVSLSETRKWGQHSGAQFSRPNPSQATVGELMSYIELRLAAGKPVGRLYATMTQRDDVVPSNQRVAATPQVDGIRLDFLEPWPCGSAEPTTATDIQYYIDAMQAAGASPVFASISQHWSEPITFGGVTKPPYDHVINVVAAGDVVTTIASLAFAEEPDSTFDSNVIICPVMPDGAALALRGRVSASLFRLFEEAGVCEASNMRAEEATALLHELLGVRLDRFRELYLWLESVRKRVAAPNPVALDRVLRWVAPELFIPDGDVYQYELSFRLFLRGALKEYARRRGWYRDDDEFDSGFESLTRERIGEIVREEFAKIEPEVFNSKSCDSSLSEFCNLVSQDSLPALEPDELTGGAASDKRFQQTPIM